MADPGTGAEVDYTSRDYTGLRESMLAHATRILPEWTSRSPGDFGVAMIELFAYMGDIQSFYQDAIQNESFLSTAALRSSVTAIANQLGYQPHGALAATGTIGVQATDALVLPQVLPAGTQVITAYSAALDRAVTYETTAAVTVPAWTTSPPVVLATVAEGRTQGRRQITLSESSTVVTVEDVGTSDGRPGQTYVLSQSPVLVDTVRVLVDDDLGATEWAPVRDLLLVGPDESVFTVATDDRGVSSIAFGDGVTGAIPTTGLTVAVAYRTGGGVYGNVAAGSIVDLATAVPGVRLVSSTAMTGGADQEPLTQIRVNAARAFRAQDRAVALGDYADLAVAVPGIADAKALGLSLSSVALYVIGPNNTAPSQIQRDAVAAYVQGRTASNVVVSVSNGSLVQINIGSAASPVQVSVGARFRRVAVQLAVTQAVQRCLAPGTVAFGSRVSVSRIYQAIMAVPGVDYAVIQLCARYDLPQTGVTDVTCRGWEIPIAGSIVVSTSGGV